MGPSKTLTPTEDRGNTTEVQQTHPLLFRGASIARLVTQMSFGHLSLALRVSLETQFRVCVTDLAIGAPYV